MTDEDPYAVTVEITRGTSTDDRDKIRTKVSAESIDELEERVEQVRASMERWADGLRDVQPRTGRRIEDDQSTLELEGEA